MKLVYKTWAAFIRPCVRFWETEHAGDIAYLPDGIGIFYIIGDIYF